ncbi:hypothetical protein GQ457_09G019200 [Hibiscus cannabinus]
MYELEPPATIGRRPSACMDSTASEARCWKSMEVKLELGSTMPNKWCGTPLHSSSVTLLVSMSRPLYIWILSELTISAGKRGEVDCKTGLAGAGGSHYKYHLILSVEERKLQVESGFVPVWWHRERISS